MLFGLGLGQSGQLPLVAVENTSFMQGRSVNMRVSFSLLIHGSNRRCKFDT